MEVNEELLEELRDCVAFLVHYLGGMLSEIHEGRYTHEKADADLLCFTHNENMDILGILGDIVAEVTEKENAPQ